jgi:hypothetical protein
MKAYGGVDAHIHVFYTQVFFGYSSASCFGRFAHWENSSFAIVINYYAMKAYRGVDAYIHVFYTPVLVGEWSDSGPGRITPGEICSYA